MVIASLKVDGDNRIDGLGILRGVIFAHTDDATSRIVQAAISVSDIARSREWLRGRLTFLKIESLIGKV
jgi:hypothetical protein